MWGRHSFRVVGRVVDEHERPVVAADVRLEPGPHTTTTDSEGAFAFAKVPARTYKVSARHDRSYAPPTLVDHRTRGPVTLRLRLGASAIFHVHAARAPVAGARLLLERGLRATTDANGRAVVHGLEPTTYQGVLLADGWADERLMLSLHEDPGGVVEMSLDLVPGARIEGVVLDRDDRPVADATVWARNVKDQTLAYEAWSESDGAWHVHARAGEYRVIACAPSRAVGNELALVSDGRSPQRDLVLRVSAERPPNRAVIAGIVVDEDGHPVAGADVRVLQRSSVHADPNGRFESDEVDDGEHEVIADAPGPWGSPRANAVRQRVRAGDRDVRLVLPTGSTVTGRVVLDGAPVPYFGLRLVGEGQSARSNFAIGIQAEDGRFAVRHVLPGAWRVAVMAPGTRLVTSREFTVTPREPVELGDLALARGQRLSGHVRDASGAGVAGARVIVGRFGRFYRTRSRLDHMFMGQYEATTAADGAYTFDGIDLAREPMRRPELMWATHVRAGASVIREVPEEDATVDLVVLGSGRIAGKVENMRGGRASVLAVRADEPPLARRAHGDREGMFAFEDVPPGDYVLELDVPEADRVEPVPVTVLADRTATATFVMTRSSVELRVRVPAGQGRQLVIEPESEGAGIGGRMRGIMRMNDDESCSFHYVRPGRYRVSLDGASWQSITVEPSPAEQEIDLRPR